MSESILPPLVDESDLSITYVHADGPGGQNVNKVASAVQLRFDVANSPKLTEQAKVRLGKLAGRKMTNEGVLVIEARRYRTQERNRADAIQRLNALLNKAYEQPKQRKKTKPSAASKEVRLKSKKQRGELKRSRRIGPEDWE